MIVRLGLPTIGIWPCPERKEIELGSPVYIGQPTDQCYKMQPQQRWQGLWRNEFEGSRFCPGPARQCQMDTPGDIIWLDTERVTRMEPDGALYAVDLIGRRTAVKAQHGHLGGSDHDLIVDRFISMKRVGRPLSKAETQDILKHCEAGARCSAWQK